MLPLTASPVQPCSQLAMLQLGLWGLSVLCQSLGAILQALEASSCEMFLPAVEVFRNVSSGQFSAMGAGEAFSWQADSRTSMCVLWPLPSNKCGISPFSPLHCHHHPRSQPPSSPARIIAVASPVQYIHYPVPRVILLRHESGLLKTLQWLPILSRLVKGKGPSP